MNLSEGLSFTSELRTLGIHARAVLDVSQPSPNSDNMRRFSRIPSSRLWQRSFSVSPSLASTDASTIPRVASLSLWQSIIPKAFRRPNDPVSVAERQKAKAMKPKDWNPATFFIVISLLIGSNAIQMISLRNDRLAFTRKTDAKIALLRETVQRVKNGEDVDVEKILGTGDPEKEKEWEEVMREIESEDTLWQAQKRKREQKAQRQELDQGSAKSRTATRTEHQDTSTAASADGNPKAPGFY